MQYSDTDTTLFGSQRCDLGEACEVLDLAPEDEDVLEQQLLLQTYSQTVTLNQDHLVNDPHSRSLLSPTSVKSQSSSQNGISPPTVKQKRTIHDFFGQPTSKLATHDVVQSQAAPRQNGAQNPASLGKRSRTEDGGGSLVDPCGIEPQNLFGNSGGDKGQGGLTEEQKARIEQNRQKALELKRKKEADAASRGCTPGQEHTPLPVDRKGQYLFDAWWYWNKNVMKESVSEETFCGVFAARDYTSAIKTSKRYAAYESHARLLTAALESKSPCFYEMVREGCPCKLYFDIEWTTPLLSVGPPDGGAVNIGAIKRIIWEVLAERFPAREQPEVLELNGSREVVQRAKDGTVTREWKHSFHLIYPDLVFRCNHALMKDVAVEVKSAVGRRFGLHEAEHNPVDLKVYSKDQIFRAPLCYKQTDATQTRLVADADAAEVREFARLPPQRQRELHKRYLRAFVTNTKDCVGAIIGEGQ